MKNYVLISLFLVAALFSALAQSPDRVNFQMVARNASGDVLANQSLGIQFVIRQGSPGGTSIYTETHSLISNDFGLINLQIGAGNTLDDFSAIDWAAGPYFLETAMDFNGGVNYVTLGTTEFVSVPYALHAQTSASDPDSTNELQTLSYDSMLHQLLLSNGGGTVSLESFANGIATNDSINLVQQLIIDSLDSTLSIHATMIQLNSEAIQVLQDTLFEHLNLDSDVDSTNELQDLSRVGDSLFIENGAGVDLSDLATVTMLDSLADDLNDSLDASLAQLDNKIIMLQSELDQDSTHWATTIAQLASELDQDSATFSTGIATNGSSIGQNQNDIQINTTEITALSSELDQDSATFSAGIATNSSSIGQNQNDIQSNTAEIAAVSSELDQDSVTFSTGIAANSSSIGQNQNDIQSNTAEIAALSSELDQDSATFSTGIASNSSSIGQNQNDIQSNTVEIAALSSELDQDSATFSTGIATNSSSIGQNQTDIQNNTVEIAALSGELDQDSAMFSAGIATNSNAIDQNQTDIQSNAIEIEVLSIELDQDSTAFHSGMSANALNIQQNSTAIQANATSLQQASDELAAHIAEDRDTSSTNEFQFLSISNDTIFLSDGGFVTLPPGFDGSFHSLTNVPAGLADGDDDTQLTANEVDSIVADNGYLTSELDGSDTNEIQYLSITADSLEISGGNKVALRSLAPPQSQNEDSISIYQTLTDPSVPFLAQRQNTPGSLDNSYYRYRYLYKKGNQRTKLSPFSSVVRILNNALVGKIELTLDVTEEEDVDSILIYRQFSIDSLTFSSAHLLARAAVTPGQSFQMIDSLTNLSIFLNPQPLADTNNTGIHGIIKTDLLTQNRTYQLPDEDGTLATLENIKIYGPLTGNQSILKSSNMQLASVTINVTDIQELRTGVFEFDRPVYITSLGIAFSGQICQNCNVGGTARGSCGFHAFEASGSLVGYRILVNDQVVYSSTSFGNISQPGVGFFPGGCTIEVDYNFERKGIPTGNSSCGNQVMINFGIYGEQPGESTVYIPGRY